MRARCGRCGIEFEVAAPGRYICPRCGTTNEVRGPGGGPGGMPGPGPMGPGPTGAPGDMMPPPPPPEIPSQRTVCPDEECGFSFIVGNVSEAPCPMCGTVVSVGPEPGE